MWKFPTLESGSSPPSSESSDTDANDDADAGNASLTPFPLDLHEEPRQQLVNVDTRFLQFLHHHITIHKRVRWPAPVSWT